jgi:hypothetical protein
MQPHPKSMLGFAIVEVGPQTQVEYGEQAVGVATIHM